MALPSSYKQLAFIQSSGTQYIDTGFTPNQDTRLDMVAVPLSAADAGDGTGFIPYGAGQGYDSNAFECYTANGQYEFNYAGQYDFLGSPAVNQTVTISHNKNIVTLDVDGTQYTKTFTYKSFTAPYTMTLFGIHRNSVLRGLLRLYSCQIYDNGTLIRNFVPAERGSDGVAGLYDLVNDVFYTNAGSGSFTVGYLPIGKSRMLLMEGTGYDIKGGKVLVGGTAYSINKGRTLVGGTGYDINFMPPIGTSLNDMTWEEIRAISDAGLAADYFSVGDAKTIIINGTVGRYTISNLSIDVFIIGIDHNASIEGEKKIHFNIGKIDDKLVCLVESGYEAETSNSGAWTMNTSVTNTGGWKACHMRNNILGSGSTPTSPTANTLLAALPSDLRAVMKPVTKYSDNYGGSNGSSSAIPSHVTATTEYLWLMSEFEVCGYQQEANKTEQNYQEQYDYYKPMTSSRQRIRYRHSDTSRTAMVLTRSARMAYGDYGFCYFHADGGLAIGASTNTSTGVAACFAV